jgi:hypothetical protein
MGEQYVFEEANQTSPDDRRMFKSSVRQVHVQIR